jgi:NAD(P)-dependent dehydrogenase (short-subunit alcohol dehydrogenase family)
MRGARVAILNRKLPDAKTLQERFPGDISFFEADVTDRSALQSALEEITTRLGTPHALINNAAIDTPPGAPPEVSGPFEDFPEAVWDEVMAINVKGVFLCCQVFGGAMARAGRGSIINIGSIYGVVSPQQAIYAFRAEEDGAPFTKPIAYSASKSALLNITRYLATYWARQGVRVNTLTLAGVSHNHDPRFVSNYTERIPIGRMADEKDYNGAVIYLVSDASRYMSGSNMVVDGGWTAW